MSKDDEFECKEDYFGSVREIVLSISNNLGTISLSGLLWVEKIRQLRTLNRTGRFVICDFKVHLLDVCFGAPKGPAYSDVGPGTPEVTFAYFASKRTPVKLFF